MSHFCLSTPLPQAGCIPTEDTQSIGGSWSALTSAGEATNLNLAHVMEVRMTKLDTLYKMTQIRDLQIAYPSNRKFVP